MARLDDIEDTISDYLEPLLASYRDTDPAKGPDRHCSKHAMAEVAINQFWHLQGKLMSDTLICLRRPNVATLRVMTLGQLLGPLTGSWNNRLGGRCRQRSLPR